MIGSQVSASMPKKPTGRRTPPVQAKAEASAREPKKTGRPTLYTKEIADRICEIIATTRMGLGAICNSSEEFPSDKTARKWIVCNEEFRDRYVQAKVHQLEGMAEEILEISDDASEDIISTDNGPQGNSTAVARAKLRVDTRKWLMSKLAPKKYGDKQEIEHSGAVEHKHLTLDELKTRMQEARS